MGEAKRRRENAVPTVYHHTSTLRTNLIWMSGVIQVEGKSDGAFHPALGKIVTDAAARRAMKDFPAVAWFTKRIEVPRVLTGSALFATDKKTGELREFKVSDGEVNAISLNRVALGFAISETPVVPWREHYGYGTPEGRDLNESARAAGDDPEDWYVSETPVDVTKASEFWYSRNILHPKLVRHDSYLADIRRMVHLSKSQGAYIPPSWLTTSNAQALARRMGVPVANVR